MIYHVFTNVEISESYCKYYIVNNYLKFTEKFSMRSLKNIAEAGIRKYILKEQDKKLIAGKIRNTEKEFSFIYAFDYLEEPLILNIEYKLNEDSVFFTVSGEINRKVYIEVLKVLSSAMRVQPISLNVITGSGVKPLLMVVEPIEEAITHFNLVDPKVKNVEEQI